MSSADKFTLVSSLINILSTDVNNKGADQTVAHREFCRLLITLANRSDPDQDQQCRPKQFDTDVNNKELDQTVRIVFFINSKNSFIET